MQDIGRSAECKPPPGSEPALGEVPRVRIAVLSDCYLPAINGVVTSINQQLEALRRLGHDVDLYCPQYPHGGPPLDNVYRFWARPFFFHKREQFTLAWPPSVLRRLWTEPYDLVHLQTPFSVGLIGLAAAITRRLPRVFHHHTLWEEYVDYIPIPKKISSNFSIMLCRGLANRCQGVVAPSEEVKERFAQQGVRRPISVIPTGIDATMFRDGQPRDELDPETEVCLYIGRLAHEKSPDALLRVFQRIHDARPQTRFWLVGDGPARTSLEQQAQELGLGEVCHFFGFVPRNTLRDFMASARLFLFTSLTETQGLVLLEAQAGGLPVVAFQASGVNEAVLPDKTGYLIETGREELMAQAAVKLLRESDLWESFSKEGRIWSENFSLERMGESLVSTYEKALKKAKNPEK
jgi:1,2-diacylglycerol 3-alpha-glucosyltransferase